jgi:hypothetical protein
MFRSGLWLFVAVFLTNLLVCLIAYLSLGWHYIRGYNEVTNFLVYTWLVFQVTTGAGGALISALLAQWRDWARARIFAGALGSSSIVVAISPLFATQIGLYAKYHHWLKTPLVDASRYGDVRLVRDLVERGENPNVHAPFTGMTPLHAMTVAGDVDVVRLLLTAGADANINDRATFLRKTPLHYAVEYRHSPELIRVLRKAGANPSITDANGITPLADLNRHGWQDREILQALTEPLE